ncbi:MAG: sensor histidine kinase, partial [Chloroflexi bacterium]|nr:sensor histidine kinase [Chloroflexota bacterium]
IRLTLVLRIAVAILSTVIGLTLLPDSVPVVLDLAVVLPSILLLAVAVVAPWRGWQSVRFVQGLLIAVIVAQALESAASRLGTQIYSPGTGIDFIGWLRRSQSPLPEWMVRRLPLNASVLFITIPALLGAWISGRRGAMRWAAFTALMSLMGAMLTPISALSSLLIDWRISTGLIGAQSIVVFITCYFVGSLADQQRAEQAQLEAANRRLAEQANVREQLATSRERVRLSRDLHDTLAHTLAGLVVQANVVAALLDEDPAAARRELARVQAVAKHGLDETRAAISDLRANMVEDLGLSGALQRQVELVAQRAGLQADFEQSGDEPQLDKASAETLFRITQEALNNVERHAHASCLNVTMQQVSFPDPSLTITVQDDGVGFDVSALDDERFGLRGMRERAELIGAHLRVDSAAGAGTRVTINLKPQPLSL